MKKKSAPQPLPERDRHLDTPSEANRDKHINFVALQNNDMDPADDMKKNKTGDENSTRDRNRADDSRPMHSKLTNNPRHATDESSTEADSPADKE